MEGHAIGHGQANMHAIVDKYLRRVVPFHCWVASERLVDCQ